MEEGAFKSGAETPLATQQLVRQLIDRQAESRSLDYKAARSFGTNKAEKAEVLKWIMALSNTRDGGYVLIGVEQMDGKFVSRGITANQASSFDPTLVGTFAQNYCSVMPNFTSTVVRIDEIDLLVIRVDEFREEPIVCTKDAHAQNGDLILRAGSIYTRTSDARSMAIDSGEAMRGLLDLAIQKRGDVLLHQIRRLVGGDVGAPEQEGLLPASYDAELKGAAELFVHEELAEPYWYLEIVPLTYDPNRVLSNAKLKDIRRSSTVSVRGWDLPHVDHEHDKAFESGIESVVHWNRYHEAHRFYRSGVFAWRRRLAEDYSDESRGTLSYESAIYSITEFYLFASRYIPLIADQGDFMIRLGVTGLDERVLQSGPGVMIFGKTTAAKFFESIHQLPVEELRASHLELANQSARRLFELYGLDISSETMSDWQKKFLDRRF